MTGSRGRFCGGLSPEGSALGAPARRPGMSGGSRGLSAAGAAECPGRGRRPGSGTLALAGLSGLVPGDEGPSPSRRECMDERLDGQAGGRVSCPIRVPPPHAHPQ